MKLYKGVNLYHESDISSPTTVISKSKPINDIYFKNAIYSIYKDAVKNFILIKNICLVIGVIGWIISACYEYDPAKPNSSIILALVIILPSSTLLAAIILQFIFRDIIKICKNLRNFSQSKEPLFCYESEILNIYESEKVYSPIRFSVSYNYTVHYAVLENNVEIALTDEAYEDYQKNNVKKMKLYFYKQYLSKNIYLIEWVI